MSAKERPLVSIVTPVYNDAHYLSECIESILAQTYPQWEYTILNNCSTDGSAEIARRYAARDARIRVYDNASCLPAVANHNAAIRRISSESKYCKIVFSDDWIFPECLDRMVSLAEQYPRVGIVGSYVLERQRVTCLGLPYTRSVFDGHEVCRKHLIDSIYVFGSANSLLYRADLVRCRDPFYNEADIHSDTDVCFALLKTNDFGFVHQLLTFTRVRKGSLTTESEKIQTSLGHRLRILLAYGAEYLSENELTDLLRAHLAEYYRFLGKSLLFGRSKEFWRYHKRELTDSGVGFSHARLARGLLETLGILTLHPERAITPIIDRIRWRSHKRTRGSSASDTSQYADSPGP